MFVFRPVHVGVIICIGLMLGSLQHPVLATITLNQLQMPTPLPLLVPTPSPMMVAAGISHTCALSESGSVKCWGINSQEQLGSGVQQTMVLTRPVDVYGLRKVRAIATGRAHTCAFNNIGAVYCWGDNSNGQLGNGSSNKMSSIVPVRSLIGGATMISSRYDHTCILRTVSQNAQQVVCWGANPYGQIGTDRTPSEFLPVPIQVLNPISVSVGEQHSCALTVTKEVYCWGRNDYGQLGADPQLTPQSVTPIKPNNLPAQVKTLIVGPLQNCVILESNEVRCWGLNDYGNLGDGSTVGGQTVWNPVKVTAVDTSQIESLSMGVRHTCISTKNKKVECWGANDYGQLGNATYQNSGVSVSVGIEPVISITAGHYHTCATLESGQVKCWGYDDTGQLGNGREWNPQSGSPPVSSPSPSLVMGLNLTVPQTGVKAVFVGLSHSCAITNQDLLRCWGSNESGQLGYLPSKQIVNLSAVAVGVANINQVTAVAIGSDFTCALTKDTTIKCWGENRRGQLGNGSVGLNPVLTPTVVQGLKNVKSITAYTNHTCALLADNSVWCWGMNTKGELGLSPNQTVSATPVKIGGLSAVSTVGNGYASSCALLTTGTVSCWGDNSVGQLGNGNSTIPFSATPVPVKNLSKVKALSVGAHHSCATLETGAIKCWGYNYYGQLGNGLTTIAFEPVDVKVLQGVKVRSIYAGYYNTCVLTEPDGGLQCWGWNEYGNIGNGLISSTPSLKPVPVIGLDRGVSAISLGLRNCVITGLRVKCWGNNGAGAVGNGTRQDTPAPANVIGINFLTDTARPNPMPIVRTTPGMNGWYKSNVEVLWNWQDNIGGSGIDLSTCVTTSTSSGEGASVSLLSQCSDEDGNYQETSLEFKIDKSAPQVLAPQIIPNLSQYPVGTATTVKGQATDAISGIASVLCSNLDTSQVGTPRVICIAKDKAGNESTRSFQYIVK